MTIKELRESKGLSQGKFAESIGIGRTAIVGYEKGRIKPSTEVAAKIKEVYGIIVDEAGVAPVDEKKTAKRGKKKDTPAEGEVTPSVEEKKPTPKKPAKRGKKKAAPAAETPPAVEEKISAPKKGGRNKAAPAAETTPAVEEKKPAAKKGGRNKAAPAEQPVAVEEKKPAPKKRGGRKKTEATPVVEEKKPAKRKAEAAQKKDGGVKVVIQSPMGGSITPEEILKKTGPVDSVYVRVDENKAYWVRGDETGSVELW